MKHTLKPRFPRRASLRSKSQCLQLQSLEARLPLGDALLSTLLGSSLLASSLSWDEPTSWALESSWRTLQQSPGDRRADRLPAALNPAPLRNSQRESQSGSTQPSQQAVGTPHAADLFGVEDPLSLPAFADAMPELGASAHAGVARVHMAPTNAVEPLAATSIG